MTHARFGALLIDDPELAERRRRLMMSGTLALTLSLGVGMLTWVGDKMGVSAVSPPKNAYAVTLQLELSPPPPPSPPPAPPGPKDASSAVTPDEVPPAVEPEAAPLESPDPRPAPKTSGPSTSPPGPSGGGGGSDKGSIGMPPGPGCLIPPCIGDTVTPPITISRPPVRTPPAPAVVPQSAVMARARFSPNPDPKRLAQTPTGRSHRTPGSSVVSFCVDERGETYDVKTKRGFRGDPEVNRICRETVARWRFTPMRVQGQARKTCSSVRFDIRFE